MAATLDHRGCSPEFGALATGGVGYAPPPKAVDERRCGAGLFEGNDITLAIAGLVTNAAKLFPEYPGPLPARLATAFAHEGPAALERLEGGFVAALLHHERLFLLRDPLGIRTLYHAHHAGRALFAIEPKALWSLPGFPRQLRPAALAQFLSFSFQPAEGTMLDGIEEVPAGHVVELTPTAVVRRHRYFCFEAPPAEPLSDTDENLVDRFRQLHAEAVQKLLPPNEPVALYLSGGIDSSVVAVEAARHHAPGVHSFAIHFGEQYAHELDFARGAAEAAGTKHEEVLIRPKDFLPRLRQIIWRLDDPIGDPVTVPNYELARHVGQRFQWVFNGEGGDPVFGGPKNIPLLLDHWYGVPRPPRWREKAYLASYRRAYEELPHLLTPEFQAQIDPERDLESVLTPYFDAAVPERFLDKLLAINIRLKCAHLILPKVERMQSAGGLIPLAPLLDERLVCFGFHLPPQLKLHNGVEKVILKRAYQGLLPQEIIDRPKSGMRVPVHFWFQGEMRRYAKKLLSRKEIQRAGIFRPDRVKQLLNYDTEEGEGRYGLRLWMLLTFEIWRQLTLENESV